MTHAAHNDDFVPCPVCGNCLTCDPHSHIRKQTTDTRRRCEHCGCVVHRRGGIFRHFGSNEACLRIRGLLFALHAIDDPRVKATLENWNAYVQEKKESR